MAHPMIRGLPFPAISGSNLILSNRGRLHLSVALCIGLPFGAVAQTVLPQGGSVASGSATIVRPNGTTMVINQGSNNAIVNWNSFSIGNGGHVDIRQPNSNSAILNRVTGNTTSEIHGRLTANGTVHLVNPNGIFIGPNGTVNAGSFAASTLGITDDDFNAGRLQYSGLGNSASVQNAGRITIGRGGYAALIGGKVSNSGTVTVPYGRIGFAAGEKVVLDVSGDQFLQVAIPSDSEDDGDALITNSGTASAEGGLIEMRAATARHAARHAINLSGVAEASSVSVRGGTIVLGGGAGGTVTVSGRVSAQAKRPAIIVTESKRPPIRGGSITITGGNIALNGAEIDASGDNGGGEIRIGGDFAGAGDLLRADTTISDENTTIRADAWTDGDGGRIVLWSDIYTEFPGTLSARGGDTGGDGGFVEVSSKRTLNYTGRSDTRALAGAWGTLLLDPIDFIINPGAGGEDTLELDLATNNVTLDTFDNVVSDPGNIEINADIDWSSGTELTLIANNTITLNGDLNGAGGAVTLRASGDLVTGDTVIAANGVSITAEELSFFEGEWSEVGSSLTELNVVDFTLSDSATFLRAVGGTGASEDPYLIADIFGLQGIGSSSLADDSFELNNDIDASAVSGWRDTDTTGFVPIASFSGTFDGAGHEISNLTVDRNDGEGGVFTGGGLFNQLQSGSEVSDLILSNIDVSANDAGGLASSNAGTITGVLIDGDVTSAGTTIGGLVGSNSGLIEDSGADVNVVANFDGFSSGDQTAGGFVGFNDGTINRSHALGDVSATNTSSFDNAFVGGFVGMEGTGNSFTINDSYAQGAVTVAHNVSGGGNSFAGGFAGIVQGTINRSYSSGTVGGSSFDFGDLVTGGFAGTDFGGIGSASNFWDVTTTGLTTSAFGTGLTTAQFQDTEAFIALASAQGWDFDTVWAPGDAGFYPEHYSTSAVLLATPNPVTLQYGQTTNLATTGTVVGGIPPYLFGGEGEVLNTAGIFNGLSLNGFTVGSQTFNLTQTSVTGSQGTDFRIIDRLGAATITPAPLTIRANDQVKVDGTTLVFNGTEFSTTGLQFSDSVALVDLFSLGAPADAEFADSPFDIIASNASGSGLENYNISFAPGVLTITQEVTDIPIPPIFIGFPLPNPTDGIDDGQTDAPDSATLTTSGALGEAENTLAAVEGISSALDIAADSCGQSSGDVTRYLACLSDALSDFADELDIISADLPPGMQNVARIVQDARVQIDQSRVRAQRRLATATTDAERTAIRRDAANEARAALQTASTEIRKSIALVRADDPELANVQRATVTTVASAVDNVGIKLTRAVGL